MTEANKIKYEDLLRGHKITLAKCGWLELVWCAYPSMYAIDRFEVRSNGELIFETNCLPEAIAKYNDLVV